MASRKNNPTVDAYIAKAPDGARAKLRAVRRIIREVVPDAEEVFSYSMPGYSYPGHPYKGMVVWFLLRSSYIGLYVRPPTIRSNRSLLKGYVTTKSAVHIPIDGPLPKRLIQTLVRANAKIVKAS